jgi:hypothetical protein
LSVDIHPEPRSKERAPQAFESYVDGSYSLVHLENHYLGHHVEMESFARFVVIGCG